MRKNLWWISSLCALVWTSTASAQHMNAKNAPCQQPSSNAGSVQCVSDAAKKSDQKLNQIYNEIQSVLQSEDRKSDQEALRKAQRAWIEFRDANCIPARGLYGGGTGGPINYWACMAAQNRQRTEDLQIGYGWILQK
jgi:uncharacterized protein YecT (DUF1311 family)